jgi:hypothetical protein
MGVESTPKHQNNEENAFHLSKHMDGISNFTGCDIHLLQIYFHSYNIITLHKVRNDFLLKSVKYWLPQGFIYQKMQIRMKSVRCIIH